MERLLRATRRSRITRMSPNLAVKLSTGTAQVSVTLKARITFPRRRLITKHEVPMNASTTMVMTRPSHSRVRECILISITIRKEIQALLRHPPPVLIANTPERRRWSTKASSSVQRAPRRLDTRKAVQIWDITMTLNTTTNRETFKNKIRKTNNFLVDLTSRSQVVIPSLEQMISFGRLHPRLLLSRLQAASATPISHQCRLKASIKVEAASSDLEGHSTSLGTN